MTTNKLFPVLNAPHNCAKQIPQHLLNNNHALKLHSQTLNHLAERGGLDPYEIYINVKQLDFTEHHKQPEQVYIELVNTLAKQITQET